jgi:hypothetical protein
MDNDKVLIKSKGLSNKLLTEEHFKTLLSGNEINIDISKIFTNIKTGSGEIKNINMTIKPELNNRLSINGGNFDTKPYHVIDGVVQSTCL